MMPSTRKASAFRVPHRTRDWIECEAAIVREIFEISPWLPFPVGQVIEGLDRVFDDFVLEILEDHQLRGVEGLTWKQGHTITVPQSTYNAACRGHGRSRFTLCHELGHLFMHANGQFARTSGNLPDEEDSEWQADVFAAALLMPQEMVHAVDSTRELMILSRSSYTAADIQFRMYGTEKVRI